MAENVIIVCGNKITEGVFMTKSDVVAMLMQMRNENKDLNEYQDGRYGYQFELYDTSSGEGSRLGEYWVDRDTGKIYLKNDKSGEFEEYTADSNNTENNGENGTQSGGTSTGQNNR